MNKNPGTRQWKYLGFVLQAAEGTRKNKAIVIAHKGSAHSIIVGCFVLRTTSFAAIELLPVHNADKNNRKTLPVCNTLCLLQSTDPEQGIVCFFT